ncbi:MAG TPA: ABC transporter substrate-binding protein [Anaerolineales bacterium]|nr:ABC transporter substrate-binding protein [Anaerolineales bacterium]
MRKLSVLLSLLVLASMILAACGGAAPATQAPAAPDEPSAPTTEPEAPPATDEAPSTGTFTSKDPTTFVAVSFGEPDNLDPALDYETAGGEVLQNVYETLVTYSGNELSVFEPLLAESYEISEDGLTYSFQLHQGVKFHDGADLTPSDVVYSFVRGMLQGGGSSPQFLIIEPFWGVGTTDISEMVEVAQTLGLEALADGVSTEELGQIPYALYDDVEAMKAVDPAVLVGVCEALYSRFETDEAAGTINMTLALPWAPFIATIAGYWSSAMDQDWVAANGGWDGSCETWQDYYAMQPENNPIYDITNGTGPFILDHWTPGEELVLVRNDNYWREPARLERIVLQNVTEWSTRFSMMQAGDADWVAVPVENRSQMDALVGETCLWDNAAVDYVCEITDDSQPFRVTLGRSTNTRSDIFFNFDVSNPDGSNTYLGSGQLDGNGIPADFFNDPHIRKAFNYCFDWDTYIGDIFNGEAIQSKSLAIEDMPGWNEDDPTYSFDLAKCEEEFKLADADKDGIPAGEDPEGDIWTTGFRFSGTYNQGNTTRQTLVEMVSLNVNTVNELFIVESVGLPWPAFLRSLNARLAPLFFVGWHEDIHDPHNWYVPYLVTFYATRSSIPAELQDQYIPLINAGVLENDPAARNEIYKELNQLVYDNPPGIIGVLGTTHGFMPRYVKNVNYNQNYSNFYYYPMYKE